MKVRARIMAVALVVALLISSLAVIPASAATGSAGSSPGTDVRYTQKIVSVLYDNSGSMNSDMKNEYALYALQMLMALLDSRDVLIITPMNRSGSTVTDTSSGYEVDLSGDRDTAIKTALGNSFLSRSPNGGTPGSTIGIAVDELEERGLKDRNNMTAQKDDKEYWLVVLTDGVFNEQSGGLTADEVVESHIEDFPSLRTIFLGLGSDAPDLSNSSLSQRMPFTPYIAKTTNDIVSAMQSVANQLSGRYTLDRSAYTVNGSTVTVDLNRIELSFKSISVIAQNCGVDIVSATYNGSPATISNKCEIVPDSAFGTSMKKGCSAVISGQSNGQNCLTGGQIVINFSGPISIDNLSILAEPALTISPYLEYNDGGTWKRTTMQYVNANLTTGDSIRVGYEVYEQANHTPVDLNKIFGDSSASITYAGKQYKVGDQIPLVVGNNEIGVSVSVMGGAYKLFTSMICIIERNPTYYRVETQTDGIISVSAKEGTAVFTAFADNRALGVGDLNAYDISVSVKKPDGSDASFVQSLESDGKVTVKVTAQRGEYGAYTAELVITSKEFGLSRSAVATLGYYPDSMELKATHQDNITGEENIYKGEYVFLIDGVQCDAAELSKYVLSVNGSTPDETEADISYTVRDDGTIDVSMNAPVTAYGEYTVTVAVEMSDTMKKESVHSIIKAPQSVVVNLVSPESMSLSQYQLTGNEQAVQFEQLFDGVPFDMTNTVATYKLTVGKTDVTKYTAVEGNKLVYVPKAEHFGNSLDAGEYDLTLTVSGVGGETLASATMKFKIKETLYEIIPIDHAGKTSDRFRLEDSPATLYFKVQRDGTPLGEEELRALLESGEIKVTDNKGTFGWQVWLPCGSNTAVEVVDGVAVISFRVTRDWIKPFHTFAAMLIFNGENPVTVDYKGVQATDAITFDKSPVWSYIWRILIILFIIHCILYIIGFFNGKCKSLPSGVFVSASVYDDSDECSFRVVKELNLTFWEKYGWHVARFFPHKKKLWYNQAPVTLNRMQYGYDEVGNLGFLCLNNSTYKVNFDNNGSQTAKKLYEFKSALSKYDGKGAKPRIKGDKPIGSEVRSVLRFEAGAGHIEQKRLTNYPFYGRQDDDGALKFVIFFVPNNR